MSTETHREKVHAAFEGADQYDEFGIVQRNVADDLAAALVRLNLPTEPKILEVGCGTGFLTEAMLRAGMPGNFLVTDVAPAMIERTRNKIGDGSDIRYAVLDAEYGSPEDGPFDLICANLALQWFEDPHAALGRMIEWLAPEGHLVATILTNGTFAEWREACEAEGVASGTPNFPDPSDLLDWYPDAMRTRPSGHHYRMIYKDGPAFITALRGLGASTPVDGYEPIKPGTLRKVMARFEQDTALATFDVVTLHYGRRKEG
jgi:malonyl-CoA O-methyltransferase